MYPTIKDFYNGIDKHTKGHMQIKGLTLKLTFIPILLLIPLVVMFFGIFNILDHSFNLFIFGFILYLFVVLLNMMVKEYYDSNILYCFCYPFALLIFFYGITIKSFPKLIHKSRVSWRGRIYNI